ncbi:hypothetical protein RCC94_02620 [Exiguobacterium acetylicum]|uniref:hypothetical protein n=1 Tax=Exiguobacterium TaxID=33986 RepID=UPI000EE5F4D3|nr:MULTISPECIES: hypothetical protein [Exiguobacterium]MDQ6466362.1 hypothetical protein [Exiguobacterium acetylicum]HAK99864.1 hypothetical protein [Exiguobacterium sp.]
MRKMGFCFVLVALTKLWLSIYLAEFYFLRKLEVYNSVEGDAMDMIPSIIWWIIILECIIGVALIVSDGKIKLKHTVDKA